LPSGCCWIQVSKPDVILGGGEGWWLPAGTPGAFRDKPDQCTGRSFPRVLPDSPVPDLALGAPP
jgi:hypothetical protein